MPDGLTPLKDLLVMDEKRFREKAALHYAESWALMEFLHDASEPRRRKVLREYFEALRAGLSPEEASARHWEPLLPALDTAFRTWVLERTRHPWEREGGGARGPGR